eukprot:scaffold67991_cov51-Phaeocystis_antarctica.AAC.2
MELLTLTLTPTLTPKDSFERGMELRAKATVFAEGCRGSLTKEVTKPDPDPNPNPNPNPKE